MQIVIHADGSLSTVYDEAIDLAALGELSIRRASHVEPDESGQWWADLAPVGGPRLGPFDRRSEALQEEEVWIERQFLKTAFLVWLGRRG